MFDLREKLNLNDEKGKCEFFLCKKTVQVGACVLLFFAIVFNLNDKVFSYMGDKANKDDAKNLAATQRNMLESLEQKEVKAVKPAVSNKVAVAPKKKAPSKTVKISVSAKGRVNPFLPSNDSYGGLGLTSPPGKLVDESDAQKVMDTTISGILFDQYSPSAIININDSDYLVKKGDKISGYKVLAIEKDKVVVQLGKNVYKAGVGELLAQDKLNYNNVPNLDRKFGGGNVSINVKKKVINQE